MDEEMNEEMKFHLERMQNTLYALREKLINVLNFIEPPTDLEKALNEYRKSIQPINNKNIGIMMYPTGFAFKLFSLTGESSKDFGQKNELAQTNHSDQQQTDEDFLKKLRIRLPNN